MTDGEHLRYSRDAPASPGLRVRRSARVSLLRIGIDTRLHARGLGIATYVDGLARALADHPEVEEVVLLGAAGVTAIDPALRPARLLALHLDVVHFPANLGWLRRGPVPHVLTVHDAIFLHARGRTPRQLAGRALMRALVPRSASVAWEVVTVSDVARQDLRQLGVDRHVHVCPHGAPQDVAPQPGPRTAVLLFAASDPRKGTTLALHAWEAALAELPEQTELLVLTAAGIGDDDARLAARLPRVRTLGRLDRSVLARLLGTARALLHTSSAEGFGLPVLEAMAGGTVVVGGLAPSVRWLAGDALADAGGARHAAALAHALVEVCTHDRLAAELASRGRRRASQFTWAASAERHLAAYKAAVAQGSRWRAEGAVDLH